MGDNLEQYDSAELTAPSWLNDQFFLEIIRSTKNDPAVELCQPCELRPGSAAGDNFASVMYRTTVRYRSKRNPAGEQVLHLIMKTVPTGEGMKIELLKNNSLFDAEIKMYGEVLPAMSKVLSTIGEHLEVPRLIYASKVPNTIVVLEDLSPQGWIPGRELIGSFEEALPAIRNIAKFHAASFYLHPNEMDLSTNKASIFFEEPSVVLPFFQKAFNDSCKAIETWDDCKQFAQKLTHLNSTFKEKIKKAYQPNPPSVSYNILNHGDFQWKNLLHKKDSSGRIVDSTLIDFQCCHWGSPAIDLLGLLDVIVDHETKKFHRNKLVFEYHRHFVEILWKLGYLGSIPSLTDLQVELLRKGFLEVKHVMVFEPFKHIQLKEATLDDFMADKCEQSLFTNERYRKVMRFELPSLLYRGLLDD